MQLHPRTLDLTQAVLVVCDLQEAFRPAIDQFERIVQRSAIVAEAAKLLGLPVLVTEQVPAKLGATVEEIRRALPPDANPIAKTAFSCCGADGFCEQLAQLRRRQVLLCGIESHVCMNQTAHDLLAGGYQVHLLSDCTSSRTGADRELGIARMLGSGAIPSSSEMAIFELVRDAKHEHFRAIQKLVK
jgi:nicotinamidase-related amidase